jgi:hypothetical protein
MTGLHYRAGAEVLVAFLCAAALVWVAGRLVYRVVGRLDIDAENKAAIQERAKRVIRALRLLAYAVAAVASVSLALRTFGISGPWWSPEIAFGWLLSPRRQHPRHRRRFVDIVRVLHLAIKHLQFKVGRRHASGSRMATAGDDDRAARRAS